MSWRLAIRISALVATLVAIGACGRAYQRWNANRALLSAVKNRDAARVEHALEAGVDPNAPDAVPGATDTLTFPLITASMHGDLPTVRVLLRHGADPNSIGAWGVTPVRAALLAGHPEVVPELRRAGAN